MNDQDIQRILGQMTNFYSEFLPMDSSFVKLLQVYGTLFSTVYKELQYAKNGTFIGTTDTTYTMPYFRLDISEGLYSSIIAAKLQGLTMAQQVSELDNMGAFVSLSFEQELTRRPVVFALTLQVSFTEKTPLKLYTDYYLRDNKIYLLPAFILSVRQKTNFLHAFNIQINDQRLERNWGSRFDLELGALLPRYEYRDVLQGFDKAYSSETTIKDIKEAIHAVTNWDTFNLQDMLSPTLPAAKKRLYDQFILSPAQFIVSVPEKIVYDKIRVGILYHLLDQVKQPETNFVTFFDISREEDADGLGDDLIPTFTFNAKEIGEFGDSVAPFGQVSVEDTIFDQGAAVTYDSDVIYDDNYHFDLDIITNFDQASKFDENHFDAAQILPADFARVLYQEFPEIPRQFLATATGTTGQYDFTCRTNTDGTASFELYGATAVDGDYTLLQTAVNDTSSSQISMIHDANLSGKTYYKIRAIAGSYHSMMTLPIDITTL